jgi:hypothetical protein
MRLNKCSGFSERSVGEFDTRIENELNDWKVHPKTTTDFATSETRKPSISL